MSKKLLIIDGSSLMYRAFFALPPLTTKAGLHTGAVYGFTNMLIKHLQNNEYDYICVAFDKSRVTFRNEIYAEYKATRQATPPDLSQQFPLIQEWLQVLGIKTIELEGYEADDIIGTLAHQANKEQIETNILTGDRDSLQLLDTHTQVTMTKKGISETKIYTPEVFAEEYLGLPPSALIDIKALMGDASDNIPGIAGIGEKTALKLIGEYKTLEKLLNNAQELKGKLKDKVVDNAHMAIISKRLATIDLNVPMQINWDEFVVTPNMQDIEYMIHKMDFRNMLDKLPAVFKAEGSVEPRTELIVQCEHEELSISSCNEIDALFASIKPEQNIFFLFTVEGDFPNFKLASLTVLHDCREYAIQDNLIIAAKHLLQAPNTKITLDLKTFYQACINCELKISDTKFVDLGIMAYLLDAISSDYSIDEIFSRYLSELTNSKLANIQATYNNLKEQIDIADLSELLNTMELPLVKVLAQMEFDGISIDQVKLQEMTVQLSQELKVLERTIINQAGEEFNLNSPKQLGKILFEKLQLPVVKKTKTGYSTDIEVLESLMPYHDIVPNIIKHRTLSKLYSTYLEGLKNIIHPATSKIHTHFQQTVTTTGRLSSTQPNLQNIPVRTPQGKKIREFFVPSAGYDYILSFDYSQIELRILAHISADPILIDAFKHNQDIHARTASEVFGIPLDDLPAEMRSRAKAVNFGIVYGISDYGLSKDLGITRAEADHYIKSYFARYQGVKAFMDNIIEQAKQDGFVQTMFNRQRYLPDINSSNFNKRSFAERTAINTPIQGTAADIIKLAMIKVFNLLKEHNLQSKLLLQVHDELVLEVPESELQTIIPLIQTAMQEVIKLDVPMDVSYSYGNNWAECK